MARLFLLFILCVFVVSLAGSGKIYQTESKSFYSSKCLYLYLIPRALNVFKDFTILERFEYVRMIGLC